MPKNRERSTPVMKKEYEAPFCRVIIVERKDILTNSTSKYQAAETQESGDFSGGAFVEWGNW